ncbi:hypothetical protein LEP1GSC186_3015 [Leptospira noguchii serovar Autumnalis str. ZUN142]|uniref:Uncharacterized protein n=1 Tax=Leptospira noguchii serovar Autumnalis str. ZUN142 TaxID=1085540 RepID=M6UV38_9LEPT|nr:hypothetical protein LEP1GSC186_3015 [Leptospira noguchii serovar Autumnalis str. ZUN142]
MSFKLFFKTLENYYIINLYMLEFSSGDLCRNLFFTGFGIIE